MSILSISISPNPANTQDLITISVVPETFTYARWSKLSYAEMATRTYHQLSGMPDFDGKQETLEQYSEGVLEAYTHAELGGE